MYIYFITVSLEGEGAGTDFSKVSALCVDNVKPLR